MRFQRAFKVHADQFSARPLVTNYFIGQGYKALVNNSLLKFERGSKWASLYSFNPANLHTFATVDTVQKLDEVEIIARLEINTVGGIATLDDKKFWEKELSNLELFLKDSKPSSGKF